LAAEKGFAVNIRLRPRIAVTAVASSLLALTWAPVTAGPMPPACNPTVSGLAVPGCPSTLLGEVGDVQHPTVEVPDLSPDVTEVYIDYESISFDPHSQRVIFGRSALNFDTRSQNLGRVPVEIRADDFTDIQGTSPVSQCVSWTTNYACRGYQRVGGFSWHDEHKHFHFDDFASYELRRLLPGGEPDFSPEGLLASSPKVSSCLVDSTKIRPDALPMSRYNSCTPAEQGISPGWADVYPAGIEGQLLWLEHGFADGRYALVVTLNGVRRLFESDADNNRIAVTLELSQLWTFNPQVVIVDKDYL
jgi:Lysyl oxidase